jgi:hypothetical protein
MKNKYFRANESPQELVMKIKQINKFYGDMAWI